MLRLVVTSALLVASIASARPAAADPASSATLLIQQGREQLEAGDELVAMRRFSDAMEMDSTNLGSYLGLADVRIRRGEWSEAEAVYTHAIARCPMPIAAWFGRAKARRALERDDEATLDLAVALAGVTEPTPMRVAILRELVSLKREMREPSAELGGWRMMRATAEALGDEPLAREAGVQARALGLYLGDLDPVREGRDAHDFVRRSLAVVARRRG